MFYKDRLKKSSTCFLTMSNELTKLTSVYSLKPWLEQTQKRLWVLKAPFSGAQCNWIKENKDKRLRGGQKFSWNTLTLQQNRGECLRVSYFCKFVGVKINAAEAVIA